MLAIPLLVESGAMRRVDRILVVDVDEAMQMQRLLARDGGSREQARAILASQASRAARLAAADDVVATRERHRFATGGGRLARALSAAGRRNSASKGNLT